jgi:hypothetical protein
MKNQAENELLSAYLDGELTPAEQAQAEQLLADSPAARRTLDEMRALAATLQSLPRQRLGVDLSDRVLHAAAKRKGADDASQLSVPGSGKPAGPRSGNWLPKIPERISRNPRLIVWPAVILTVAVLLMVFNPEPHGNQPIARGPNDQNPGGKPPVIIKGNPGETKTPPVPAALVGVIVLECQVSDDVIEKQEYRKILDANNITLPDKSASATLGVTAVELADAAKIDSALVAENPATLDPSAKGVALAVDVTPAQFAGILDRLQSQPDTYRDVGFKTLQSGPPQSSISAPTTKRLLIILRTADKAGSGIR